MGLDFECCNAMEQDAGMLEAVSMFTNFRKHKVSQRLSASRRNHVAKPTFYVFPGHSSLHKKKMLLPHYVGMGRMLGSLSATMLAVSQT